MKVLFVLATVCVCAHAAFFSEHNEVAGGHAEHSFIHLQASGSESGSDRILLAELQAIEANEGRNIIEDIINDLLNSLRDVVINGNDVLPPLDPLEIEHLGPFRYDTTGFRSTLVAEDIHLEGLRWYTIDHVNFNILRLTFSSHLTIPRLTLTGKYAAQARLALLVTHNAAGNFRVFLNRIELGVDTRLGTNILGGGHLVLRNLDIKINIADTQIRIDGMTGSSLINSAISSFVQNLSQSVIQSQLENVSTMLSEELFDTINDILKDYRLADIMG